MEHKLTKGKYAIWISEDRYLGYFEHEDYGDEAGGGLWFSANALMDYDGVFELPQDVIAGLRELGFFVNKDFE